MQNLISIVLMSLGLVSLVIAGVGLLRLPDFFTRTHAISKTDSLSMFLLLSGLAVHEGFTNTSLKLALIMVFVIVTNATGAHALARAAFRSGQRAWFDKRKPKEDEL